jgi:predicted membrane protein
VHDPRLPPPRPSGRPRGSWPSLFTRILTVAAGTLVLVGAVAISFVVFVIVLTALLVIGLYVWWKTRHFRRQLEEQLNAQRSGAPRGETIEGEVIRKHDSDAR